MGRYYGIRNGFRKGTVDEAYTISTSFLKKYDYLRPKSFKSGSIVWSKRGKEVGTVSFVVNMIDQNVRFIYRNRAQNQIEWKDKDYTVALTSSPCNLGGIRWWFICPSCIHKVGTLHLYGDSDFTCRVCLDLSYESRNDQKQYRKYQKLFDYDKVQERIHKLRTRFYNGMPTRKYRRLLSKSNKLKRMIIGVSLNDLFDKH